MNENQNGMPNPYDPNNGAYPSGGAYPGNGYNTGGYQNMGGYQNAGGYPGNGGYSGAGYGVNSGARYGYGGAGGWQSNQPVYSTDQAVPLPVPESGSNKKRIGLVAGLLGVVLLLVGVLVAVTLLPSEQEPDDPVSVAVSKVLSGAMPESAAIDGKVNFASSDRKAFVQSAELRLKSELMPESLINSTTASLNAKLATGGELSLKLSGNYEAEGDVFVKVDGIKVFLQNQESTSTTKNTTNSRNNSDEGNEITVSSEYLKCLSDVDSGDDCKDLLDDGTADANNAASLASLVATLRALSSLDGEWLRIPTSGTDSSMVTGLVGGDSDLGQCAVNLVSGARNNQNTLGQLYGENQFVYSMLIDQDSYQEELSELDSQAVTALLAQNEDEDVDDEEAAAITLVYQMMFSDGVLANFLGAIAQSGAASGLEECLGQGEVNAEAVAEMVNNLPHIFVTLDDALNFTKIYFAMAPDGKSTAVVGIDLSYPDSITVTKPGNYQSFSEVIRNLSEGEQDSRQ